MAWRAPTPPTFADETREDEIRSLGGRRLSEGNHCGRDGTFHIRRAAPVDPPIALLDDVLAWLRGVSNL